MLRNISVISKSVQNNLRDHWMSASFFYLGFPPPSSYASLIGLVMLFKSGSNALHQKELHKRARRSGHDTVSLGHGPAHRFQCLAL